MLINWFTVFAQVINFLILVWLLKRYLYKPILSAIEERENRISSQIKNAEIRETDAKLKSAELQKAKEEFEKGKDFAMTNAKNEAASQRKLMIDEARKEAGSLKEKFEKTLKDEQEYLSNEIQLKATKEIFEIAKKTLKELANSKLEDEIVNVLIHRIKNIPDKEKEELAILYSSKSQPLLVRSAFDLTPPQQAEIEKSIKTILRILSPIRFEMAPELVSGIELIANGYKLSWSITNYLASLEKSINETIASGYKNRNSLQVK